EYGATYGQALPALDEAWQGALRAQMKAQPLAFEPALFFHYLDRVEAAYRRLYAQAQQHGDKLDPVAYHAVDTARLAVDRHDFASAEAQLRLVEPTAQVT